MSKLEEIVFRQSMLARTVETLYGVVETKIENHWTAPRVISIALHPGGRIGVVVMMRGPDKGEYTEEVSIPVGATKNYVLEKLEAAMASLENRRNEAYQKKRGADVGKDRLPQIIPGVF